MATRNNFEDDKEIYDAYTPQRSIDETFKIPSVNSFFDTEDQNEKMKLQEEEIAKQEAVEKNGNWSREKIVAGIDNLIIGANNPESIVVPDISITDDIGESDGFQEIINAKLVNGSSVAGFSPEINADKYQQFDSNKQKHDFYIDYKYKDIESMQNIMDDYDSVNELYGYSQSFDSMIELAVEDGAELTFKSVLAKYISKYNSAVLTLKQKQSPSITNFVNTEINTSLKKLKSYKDLIIVPIVQKTMSPSDASPGEMVITYGPYYKMKDDKTFNPEDKHSENGIDIYATWDSTTFSFESGEVVKVKKSFNGTTDKYANYVSVKSKEDGSIVTYKHITGSLKKGDNVEIGTPLGKFDKSGFKDQSKTTLTGNKSTDDKLLVGQHLHIEVKDKDGKSVNVIPYIAKRQPNLKMRFSPKSSYNVGLSVEDIYLAVAKSDDPAIRDTLSYETVKKHSQIIVPKSDDTIVSSTAGSAYILQDKSANTAYPVTDDKQSTPDMYPLINNMFPSMDKSIDLKRPNIVKDNTNSTGLIIKLQNSQTARTEIVSLLNTISAAIDQLLTEVYHNGLTSVYKIYTYDFSKKIEDININMVPGSSAKIMMQGENAPFIQSTGGRTKSVGVTFVINSITDLARLSMLFRVVDSTDHQMSMLLMTRSIKQSGTSKTRLKHITEYMLQETFETSMKDIIGKKLYPRFDEPVTIRNEFINSMGISTCIPTSLEIKTVDENPNTFNVIINFNAINLGNRNIESLKKMKTGSNIPLLPLATRLMQAPGDDNKSVVFNEKKLLATVGTTAAKMALAEFLPIYIISRIKRLRDNIITTTSITQEIDINNALTLGLVLSNKGFDDNMATLNKVADDIFNRDITGDIRFNKWAESITNAAAWIFTLVLDFKRDKILKTTGTILKAPANLLKKGYGLIPDNWKLLDFSITSLYNTSKEVVPKLNHATSLTSDAMILSGIAASITTVAAVDAAKMNKDIIESEGLDYISFNILSLLPVYLNDLLNEYLGHLKDNTIEEFILTCASDALLFIDSVSSKDDIITRDFPSPILFKNGETSKYKKGIRLFINASGYSLKKGMESATEILKQASSVSIENKDAKAAVNTMVFLSLASLNYWSLSLAYEISTKLIDKGGSGIYTAMVSNIDPNTGSVSAIGPGLFGIKTTAALINTSSTDIYVKHIIDAINAVITSTNLDILISTFLLGDGSQIQDSNEKISDEAKLFTEKLKMTQSIGYQICKKYNIQQEILSGDIITNSFPSIEVREYTGYTGMIIMQMLSKYSITGYTNEEGLRVPSIAENMEIILPGITAEALYGHLLQFKDKVWELIKELNVGWQILLAIAAIALTILAGWEGAAVKGIVYILSPAVRAAQALLLYGSIGLAMAEGMFTTGANVIIRKGNLLKVSIYLTNLIRSGISHNALIEIGVDTKIWFKELIYFGSDIVDTNGTSYIDFPIFSYMGEAMMPDFWVSKIGFLGTTYNTMINNINTITASIYENQAPYTTDDYKVLLDKFKERLEGVDSNSVKKTEQEFFNNLKYAFKGSVVDYYFNPALNVETKENTPKIMEAAAFVTKIASAINGYINVSVGRQPTNFDFAYVYINAYANIITNLDPKAEIKAARLLASDQRFSIEESRCALTIDVYPTYCKIKRNPIYTEVIQALRESKVNNIDKATASINASLYSTQIVQQAANNIVGLLGSIQESSKVKTELLEAMKDDTVNNLMMLKTLVGSAMGAVGKPGIGMMKTTLSENMRSMVTSALYLRSGYQYPTLKLFFIEEDSEAYYLFDDLYSYASIVDFSVSDDLDSPLQLMQINVTNIFGHLDDISSDKNPEYTFSSDHEGSSNLNSMMLKIGCKIKIQAGYNTLLDESCTIFTGRISNIQFGEITRIEATSMGDSLLEEVSLEKVKIYGPSVAVESSDILSRVIAYTKYMASNYFTTNTTYETQLDNIKTIIGYVLTDATLKGKMDDFTITPELSGEFDRDVIIASNDYTVAIKNKFFPNIIDKLFKTGGLDTTTSFNKQLFENINITDSGIDEMSGFTAALANAFSDSTIWVSINQTVWDIMQEINMLLPNNIIRVLPYETRSTLVWGGENGYYRYKRGSELKSMVATSIADKVRFTIEQKPKFQTIMSQIKANWEYGSRSHIWDPFENSISLLLLVAEYANTLTKAYIASGTSKLKVEEIIPNLDIRNPDHLYYIFTWLGIDVSNSTKFTESIDNLVVNHQAAMTAYNSAVAQLTEKGAVEKVSSLILSDIDITDINVSYNYFGNKEATSVRRQRIFIKMMFMEFASEIYLEHAFKTAASSSESYKRISNVHVKTSGRDIISNNIILQEAYNAVKITTPSEELSDIISNSEEGSRGSTAPVPIHYKLEPRVWKVYSSFFRNINIFPKARNSVLAMYSSSTLTNLIKQSYGGTITIFGDPNIKAGDRIFIHDENTDLYGFIEVNKIVTIFSQQQGYISIITPSMISKSQSSIKEYLTDSLGKLIDYTRYIVLGVMAIFLAKEAANAVAKTKRFKSISEFLENRTAPGTSMLGKTANMIKKIGELGSKDKAAVAEVIKFRDKHNHEWNMFLKEIVEAKNGVQDIIFSKNFSNNGMMEELVKYSNSHPDIFTDITKLSDGLNEAVVKLNEALAAKVFVISNREAKNIENLYLTALETEMKQFISTKLTSGVQVPDDLIKSIIDNIKSNPKTYGDFVKNMNDKYQHLNNVTMGKSIDFGKIDPSINADLARAGLLSMAEVMAFNARTLFADLGKVAIKTGKWGFLYYFGTDLMKAGRDLADLCLQTTLTAHSVVISPLFFRGEPFISNLDGMDKIEGEQAGLFDVIGTKASSAMSGLKSALTDPYSDFKANYNRVIRETFGNENTTDQRVP